MTQIWCPSRLRSPPIQTTLFKISTSFFQENPDSSIYSHFHSHNCDAIMRGCQSVLQHLNAEKPGKKRGDRFVRTSFCISNSGVFYSSWTKPSLSTWILQIRVSSQGCVFSDAASRSQNPFECRRPRRNDVRTFTSTQLQKCVLFLFSSLRLSFNWWRYFSVDPKSRSLSQPTRCLLERNI